MWVYNKYRNIHTCSLGKVRIWNIRLSQQNNDIVFFARSQSQIPSIYYMNISASDCWGWECQLWAADTEAAANLPPSWGHPWRWKADNLDIHSIGGTNWQQGGRGRERLHLHKSPKGKLHFAMGGSGGRRVGTRLSFKVKKDFNSVKTRDSVHYCCC